LVHGAWFVQPPASKPLSVFVEPLSVGFVITSGAKASSVAPPSAPEPESPPLVTSATVDASEAGPPSSPGAPEASLDPWEVASGVSAGFAAASGFPLLDPGLDDAEQ
jgi:hypothetical protein